MFYPAVIYVIMIRLLEPVSSSYIPQTCITTPYDKESWTEHHYHFLDIFNEVEYNTCSDLTDCRCQNKSTGQFHTECHMTWRIFDKFPKDSIFPGTTHLTFVGSTIRTLEDDSFSTLTELFYLDLSFTTIQQISSLAFNKLNKLRIMLLRNNYLEVFPRDIFTPLSKALRILDISYSYGFVNLQYEALSTLSELEEIVFNIPSVQLGSP